MKFRKVDIKTPGSLFFHSMPGFQEPFTECCTRMQDAHIGRIICLTSTDEMERKSPDYLKSIQDHTLPIPHTAFPITNAGVPDDPEAFFELAEKTAQELQEGTNVLVHCAGGVGRTGTFGACVLHKLGLDPQLISTAGGKAETEPQRKLLAAL